MKLAGDGAVMTRNTSFQMFSFSLMNWRRSVFRPSHVRTVAVVVGEESFETLRDGMGEVFDEVNDLIRAKEIEVDGQLFPLQFFLCGHMKFKQKILGLQGATADYACPKCTILKDSRWDMSVDNHGQQSATSGWVRVRYRYLVLLRKSRRCSAGRDRDQGERGPIDELRRNFLSGHLSVVCLDVFLPFSK